MTTDGACGGGSTSTRKRPRDEGGDDGDEEPSDVPHLASGNPVANPVAVDNEQPSETERPQPSSTVDHTGEVRSR